MKDIDTYIHRLRAHMRSRGRAYGTWMIIILLFAALSCYMYLGPVTFSCTDSLASNPGDQTGGLIAFNSLDNKTPWWGYTNYTNAPYGEMISNVVHMTSQTLFIPFWALSKIAGPVCGYNLLGVVGFTFSATVMCAFIYRLIRRKSFGFLAGAAYVFTPYLVTTTGVHISYVFCGIFVLLGWAIYEFVLRSTKKNAVALGLIIGAITFTDIYFVYIGAVMILAILLCLVPLHVRSHRKNSLKALARYKNIVYAMLTICICILPLIYARVTNASAIDSLVSSTRNEILYEANVYGARPREYFTPNSGQPVFSYLLGDTFTTRDQHGSNPGETTLSLSLTLVVVSIIGLVFMSSSRQKRSYIQNHKPIFIVFIVSIVIGLTAFLFSLPPEYKGFLTPTFAVVHMTSVWRVFARIQVLVNLGLVVCATLSLWYLTHHMPRFRQYMIVSAVFLLIMFEYLTFGVVKPSWSFSHDVPDTYRWLSTNQTINRIALYPLDEQSRTIYPTYYSSYQRIHNKQTINGIYPNSSQSTLRNSIRDLDAPQTAPVLRALGVDTIVVNSPRAPALPSGEYSLIYSGQGINPTGSENNRSWVYKINGGNTAAMAVVAPPQQFDSKQSSPTNVIYEPKTNNSRLELYTLPGNKKCTLLQVSFEALGSARSELILSTTSGRAVSYERSGDTIHTTIRPQDKIALHYKQNSKEPVDIEDFNAECTQ